MNKAKLDAICTLTELEFQIAQGSICSRSKKQEHCTVRTAFVGLLEMIKGFKSKNAAVYINRSVGELNHIRRQHKAWIQVDSEYAKLFEQLCNAYKMNLEGLTNVELLETKSQLESDIKKRVQQLVQVMCQLEQRGIETIMQ